MYSSHGYYFLNCLLCTLQGSCDRTEPPKKGLLPDPIFMKDDLLKTPLVRQLCQQQPNCMYLKYCQEY